MLRKIMIGFAAVIFAGALAASTTADAQRGGGRGGGIRAGSFGGGGIRAGGFGGGGIRAGGFVGGPRAATFGGGPRVAAFGGPRLGRGFVGPRGVVRGGFIGPRFAGVGPRFRHRRAGFAFAAAPLFIGAGIYSSCWRWTLTPLGWQRVWVCNYPYGYGYDWY